MVWYNGDSALDKAVERHNSGEALPEKECGCVAAQAECSPPPREKCAEHRQCVCPKQPQEGLLSALTKDRDFLLLAALLLILMHEKADKKLILALAFVLFA